MKQLHQGPGHAPGSDTTPRGGRGAGGNLQRLQTDLVTTGYWPRRDRTDTWHPHVTAVIQNVFDAIAPTEGISCIKVELGNSNSSKTTATVVMAIRITGTQIFIGRWTGKGYNTVLKADFDSKGLEMTLHAAGPQRSYQHQFGHICSRRVPPSATYRNWS